MSLFVRDKHVKSIFIFSLENEFYGLTIEETNQVLQFTDYNKIPGSPDYVLGVFDVRGDVVTLIDLKKKLSIENKQKNQEDIILVNYKEEIIGLLVDKAITLQRVPIGRFTDKLDDASNKIDHKYLNGTVTLEEGEVINILNLDPVLVDYERQKSIGSLDKGLDKNEKIELTEKELTELDLVEDDSTKGATPS
jgi:purine-binding chemotaxis protein CheW